LIVVLWRGGLRVAEALALGERDLDSRRGSLLVRNGKGGRRRIGATCARDRRKLARRRCRDEARAAAAAGYWVQARLSHKSSVTAQPPKATQNEPF